MKPKLSTHLRVEQLEQMTHVRVQFLYQGCPVTAEMRHGRSCSQMLHIAMGLVTQPAQMGPSTLRWLTGFDSVGI